MNPRLTVVIPTHDRPEMLARALRAALLQSVPVRVIVADDGDDRRTSAILRDHFADRLGHIRHLINGPISAWTNWRRGMEAADTEYVAWLQDDDVICRRYAERILHAFDGAARKGQYPHVWMGRLTCADDSGRFGMWYCGNGPWIFAQDLHGQEEPAHWSEGACIAASSYFTSWSLSPALAYRNGPRLRAALAAMPANCDIFVERIIPAELACEGGFLADAVTIGHWVQHDDNFSRKLWADQPRQTRLLVRHLDNLLDRLPGWEAQFGAWCKIIPPMQLVGWLKQLDTTEREGGRSRHGRTLRRLMWESMTGRVRLERKPPWWRRVAGFLRRRAAL